MSAEGDLRMEATEPRPSIPDMCFARHLAPGSRGIKGLVPKGVLCPPDGRDTIAQQKLGKN